MNRRHTLRRGLIGLVFSILCLPMLGSPPPRAADAPALKDMLGDIQKKVADELPSLETLYKHLHAHPELSNQEVATAARLAKEMKAAGFDVTEKVGGTGLVCIFKNGKGPTVLVRTDMDALPVVEKTGVPYASEVKTRDKEGNVVGVMHACGHDVHMASWIGTARTLAALKDRWQGTLIFIAQPAEEIGSGARQMIDDKLFDRFGIPDVCFALHSDSRLEHGHINYSDGLAMANVDSVDVVVKGRGGHGAAPHTTIDPVVLAAKIVLDLQTIVSREMNPTEPAVVTVGSIHGGTKHNIIPNEVKLQLTVRTTRDATRKQVLESVERIAKAAAVSMRAPEPVVTLNAGEFTPALNNDAELTRKTIARFKEVLGAEKVHPVPPMMGGEDFSRYAKAGEQKVPIFMFWLGTVDPQRVADSKKEGGKPLPSMHSDQYAPVPGPSIQTGVQMMSLAVLNIVAK